MSCYRIYWKTGRGTGELYGLNGQVDIINSILGKALQEFIDLLRQKSRPYLFSNSLAPSNVGSSLKVSIL
jgi:glycine C-acetyltransferase